MNEGNMRRLVKAYLVADIDFTGPLPVIRQFSIFSRDPYHEPGIDRNRTWAVLMVREAGSFAKAKEELLRDLEVEAGHRPYAPIIQRMLDEAPDAPTHALKFRLPQALDEYLAVMPVPDHPFFKDWHGRRLRPMRVGDLQRALHPNARTEVR